MAPADTKELRLDMGRDYMSVLDAMALLKEQDRSTFVRLHLQSLVDRFIAEHIVSGRLLQGNPLVEEIQRKGVK